MNKREIKKNLNDTFEKNTPEILDKIMDDINGEDKHIADIIEFKPRKKHTFRNIVAVAAVIALIFSFSVYDIFSTGIAYSTVSIDVNPSVSLKVNSKETVVECEAINGDGKTILNGMDLKGSALNVAVNALIGSMLVNGYLSDTKNTVLVSVAQRGKDNKELSGNLSREISSLLTASLGDAAVVSVNLDKNNEYGEIAEKYGITQGKAALIKAITDNDPTINFEDILSLSVNDLNLLYETRKDEKNNITSLGTSNSSSYIGKEEASQQALKIFPNTTVKSIELDFALGRMTYDIELTDGETEYETDIDAVNGECLKAEIETTLKDFSLDGQNEPVSEDDCIALDTAQEIALDYFPFDQNKFEDILVTMDYEQMYLYYNVEYYYNGLCYDFDIDAVTGEVLNWEIEAIFSENINIDMLKKAYASAIDSKLQK